MTTSRRGVAAATAVSLLAMVGVTLAAMGAFFASEARRTRDATTEAQLRQLLLAGATIAARVAPVKAETPLELPPSLAADGAHVVVRPVEAPEAGVMVTEVDATIADRRMTQTLRFALRDGRWQVTGATLGP